MSNTETPDTTVSTASPVSTVSTATTDKELKNTETTVDTTSPDSTASTSTPVSTIKTGLKTDLEILDSTNALCNTVLYCLTKGFYPGADAHLVNQSKEFVKAIKLDVENRRKQVVNGQVSQVS